MSHRIPSLPLPRQVSRHVSRRGFLQVSGASALGVALAATVTTGAARAASPTAATDPFATVRDRWATLTSGGAIDPADPAYATALTTLSTQASTYLGLLDTTAGSTQPFTDLVLGSNSANVTSSFSRLGTLALAYVTPGTTHTGDAATLQAVTGGLDALTGSAYSATGGLPQYGYGNWWDWQIGAPQALQDAANLIHSALTPAQISNYCAAIDHFVPDPTVIVQKSGTTTSTGANRLDLCRVLIIRGALGGDSDKLATGAAGIAPTLPFVTSGDGLYADGSFLQHGYVAYTGTYGGVWLGDAARLMSALSGSDWQVSDPDTAHVFFAATDAFAPVVHNGLMLDSVRGRAIARSTEPGSADGLAAARNLIILSGGAPDAETATRLQGIAKGWLQRTPAGVTGTVASIAITQQVLTDSTVPATPEPVNHRLFAGMDRAVHRRPGWAASISMASDRIAYYENDGSSNLRGWHTGDGMVQLYLDSDKTQYDDAFWPTVDPYRLPGTTASRLPLADGQGGSYTAVRPGTAWVGGATDGEYAAVGQDLQGPWSTLRAKKSWFCLDDSVVCLGAGITSTDGTGVDSVIDNRNLGATGTPALTVDGADQPTTQGWSRTFGRARWARIEGVGGYVFPQGGAVTALREQRTGAWADIDHGDSTTPDPRNYLTLWFDHGTDPTDAHYSYILMPGARKRAVAERAADRGWLRVLANSADQQGVSVPSRGVLGVNFFGAGTVGPLTADAPACVLIREHHDGTATVCVSDPARRTTGLTLTWNRPVRAVTSRPAALTTAATGRSLRLTFGDLTGLAGATQKTTVRLG